MINISAVGIAVAAIFVATAGQSEPAMCRARWTTVTGIGELSASAGKTCRLPLAMGPHDRLDAVNIVRSPAGGKIRLVGRGAEYVAPTAPGPDSFVLEFDFTDASGRHVKPVRFSVSVD